MTKQYSCEICKFSTIHQSSLSSHKKSKKHIVREWEVKNSLNYNPESEWKIVVTPIEKNPYYRNFSCTLCEYSTKIKGNYNRHCKSQKHLRNQNPTNIQKSITPYECIACDKKFKTRIQCVKHLQNLDHQYHVRKNYPQTLFHTSDGLCLTGINVKLCAEYFRFNGAPCNVKIPIKRSTNVTPKRKPEIEIDIIQEFEQPTEENIDIKNDKFEFTPITNEEIESAELYTRCEFQIMHMRKIFLGSGK